MSLLNQAICLRLNSLWQPLGYCTVKEAIIALNGSPDGTPPALALDMELDEAGNIIKATPTKWEDWIALPVRASEPAIAGVLRPYRAPLIIVDTQFSKMPKKAKKLSSRAIHERDANVDQYTGEVLDEKDLSVDHVIPRDVWKKRGLKGSPNTWRNMVTCKRDRNFSKSNKTNHQAKLGLIRRPSEPKAVPVAVLHKPRLPAHLPFFPHQHEQSLVVRPNK